jgi:chaperonin GroES
MANPKLRPLYDRVLVKRVESETTTKGGLIIPDTAKEKPLEGEIVAVGNGRVLDDGSVRPLTAKVGDRVLFAKYAETEVKVGNDTFLLLREDDLLGILDR